MEVEASESRRRGGEREVLQSLCRKVGARFASEVGDVRDAVWRTGIGAVDGLLGGIPEKRMTEVVAEGPGSGGTWFVHRMLEVGTGRGGYAALIDGGDGFDPDSAAGAVLRRVYWVRCAGAGEALRAADLLAGDGNFSLLLLDVRQVGLAALREIRGERWYRLQRTFVRSGGVLVVLTPGTAVPAAAHRIQLRGRFDLSALEEGPEEWNKRVEAGFPEAAPAICGVGNSPA